MKCFCFFFEFFFWESAKITVSLLTLIISWHDNLLHPLVIIFQLISWVSKEALGGAVSLQRLVCGKQWLQCCCDCSLLPVGGVFSCCTCCQALCSQLQIIIIQKTKHAHTKYRRPTGTKGQGEGKLQQRQCCVDCITSASNNVKETAQKLKSDRGQIVGNICWDGCAINWAESLDKAD